MDDDRSLVEAPPAEILSILAGYDEARRRDGEIATEKWHWKIGACLGWSVSGVLALLLCWILLTKRDVQAFVQVVQVDDSGKVVPMGVPSDLLAYEPADAQWLEMLGQWIRHVRWRGSDPQLAQEEWRDVYLHTCGQARRILQHVEEVERPFVLGKKQVSVVLESITKTPAPQSFNALWSEWVTQNNQPPVVQRWSGTFTVGRMKPRDQAAALSNRLGLCVASFDISMQPAEK